MVDPKPSLVYEIRGEPIGIPCVVVVRVAVGVHIAEVVVVVVIRRTLPPIRSGTHGRKKPQPTGYTEIHPIEIKTYLPLSLFRTFVSRPFSASISSPSSCDIRSNFFFASVELTLSPFDFVKHPSGFSIIRS